MLGPGACPSVGCSIETHFPSRSGVSFCGTFWGCRTQARSQILFELVDQEGPLSVITGLITEIRHLTLLMGIFFHP